MSLGKVRWAESSEKWPQWKQPLKALTLAVGVEGQGSGVSARNTAGLCFLRAQLPAVTLGRKERTFMII